MRLAASRDGNVAAAAFHPCPKFFARLLMWILRSRLSPTIEFETEFSDDTFVITTTVPASRLLDPPPLLLRAHLSPGTAFADVLPIHCQRVSAFLKANSGVLIRPVRDFVGVQRMQNRQHAISAIYREMVGGLSVDEIKRLGRMGRARAEELKAKMQLA